MKYNYRTPSLCFLSLILGLGAWMPLQAQNITVAPPQRINQSGQPAGFQFLFKSDEALLLVWDVPLSSAQLKIGTSAGTFDLASLPISGNQALFRPSDLNLGTGSYYAVITNASGNTLSSIQQQAASNSAVLFSSQIRFAVESPTAPSIIAPRGTITDPTPVFEWEAVPGVTAYFLVVSSTPFELDTDPVTDEIVIRGATAIWQTITTATSIRYGETVPNPQVPTLTAPPLSPGTEYNYTILNVYDELDPNFTSDVFGTVNAFVFDGEQTVTPPNLTAPAENASFFAEPRITFSWDPVEDANDYTFFLFERRNDGSSEIDFPVSSQTTTNTVIDYAARANLRTGTYVWSVVANDEAGSGASSDTRIFTYEAPMGDFTVSARATDGQSLTGVDVRVRSLDGGFTPLVPFNTLQASTVSDSLVAGLYEFEATKSGYADTTIVQEIIANQQNNVRVALRLLPSSISGLVQDETGAPVSGATVTLTNTATAAAKQVTSSAAGIFSAGLSPGTYAVKARKVGFRASSSLVLSVVERQQLDVALPLVLQNDAAQVSGRVINGLGSPIQRATVTAQQGDVVFQTQTTGTGDYSFTLTSGTWQITASREGFVTPAPLSVALSKDDNLQNQNFTLQGRANQISGTVQELITRADGTRDQAFLQGATVTATPLSGSAVTATTNLTGEFTLNLGRGTFTLRAAANGFSLASEPVTLDLAVGETLTGISFQLTPNTGSLSGLVTLLDGSEVEDAVVRVEGVGETRTTASGAYNLRVPPGTHVVSVSKAGLVAPPSQTVVVSLGDNLTGVDFTMLPDAASISGTVRSAGQAIVEAIITATNGALTFTATSNTLGAYVLNVPAGTWTLNASRSGFASSGALSVSVGAGQESIGNNFEMTNNTARIEGVVANANVPISNASVVITALNDATNSTSTFTRNDGTFAARVTAGAAYRVTASSVGFRTRASQTEALAAGSQISLDFDMLAAAATVSGTVRNAGSQALAGASVVAIQGGSRSDSTFTDINGRYQLGLNAANTTLEIRVPGYATASRALSLSVGQTVSNVDFQLDENFSTLTGTVRSRAAGTPIEGVTVRATSALGGGTSTTAADGTYLIPQLIEGVYTVRFERGGFADTTVTDVAISAGQNVTLNRRLTRAEGSISGVVQNSAGSPVSGATVTATSTSGQVLQTLTGADGSYQFTDLRLGVYTVTASRAGFTSTAQVGVTLDATTTQGTATVADLVRNTGVLAGQIEDVSSGGGLLGVRVAVAGSAGSASTVTNTTGQYRIENLAPGTYTISLDLTGFSGSGASVDVANGQTTTRDLEMAANDGQITGRVTNQNSNALGFPVTVRATWQDLVFTVQSGADGNYAIEDIAPGRTYTVSTEIFEEGFQNATTTVDYPQDATTLAVNLTVTANTAQITGNAGTAGASIQALNAATGTVVKSATSSSDGSYRIRLLPAGSYQVRASRQGFSFSPATRIATLSVGGSATANFSANSNVGTLTVNTEASGGSAQAGVTVSALSADNTVTRSGVTGANGRFTFADIPGGKVYIVQATLEGFAATPATREVTLGAGQQQTASFTLVRSTSSISGTVRNSNGSAVGDVNIQAQNTGTGRVFRATSAANGTYSIGNLPSGSYSVTASKSGFQPGTLSLTLGDDEQRDGQDLTVSATTVTLRGNVVFGGSGVAGIRVTATSATQLTTQTANNGSFTFANVPISPGASDTTSYRVTISAGDIASQTRVVRIAGDQAGQTITLDNFVLPSGQIVLSFTDGIDPLDGVTVTFTPPNGTSQTVTTDETGAFASSNRLGQGTYRITASKAGFLTPSAEDLRLILENSDQQLTRTIPLPYLHTPPETISASRDANLSVRFRQGFSASNTTARIFFRRASENDFNEASMARQDTSFTGAIPAQRSLETITYFIEVEDGATGITYTSPQLSFEPLAEDILTTAAISPGVNGVRLRQGDTYRLRLAIRDGINESLTDQFIGGNSQGAVDWVSSNPSGLSLAFPNENDPTVVDVTAQQAGSYSLRVVTTLSGVRLASESALEVVNTPIGEVAVSAPDTRLSNTATGIQISYGVVDTSGASVLIGNNNVSWTLSTEGVAEIDEQGFLVPTDARFIGPIAVTLTDLASGLSATTEVSMFANVDNTQAYTLVDNQGMSIVFPQGSIPFPAEVGLIDGRAEASKKRVFPEGSNDSYTVSDRIYRFTFRAEQALPGDSLVLDAQLTLPVDPSLRLHEGDKEIAVFDASSIQWTLVSGGSSAAAKSVFQDGGSVTTNAFRKVGEYAVLTQNEPLGIQHLSVLPSPFSPDTGPVKIGYFLNTSDPPASVTIRIYNIRGELVRTLLKDDPQTPGRYGSRTGNRELSWDGLTDAGTLARNGRYIIQIIAEDSTGKETEIIPVVLVK